MSRHLLLLMLFFCALSLSAEKTMNRTIAEAYLEKAYVFLQTNETDKAGDLIDSASEFAQDSSDYLYLKGLLFQKTGHISQSMDSSSEALQADNWSLFSYGQGVRLHLENLLRTKHYSEILEFYSEIYPVMKNDQKVMELTGQAFHFLGIKERGSQFLKRGLILHPESIQILESLFLLTGEVRYLEKALLLIPEEDLRDFFFSLYLKLPEKKNILFDHFHKDIFTEDEKSLLQDGSISSFNKNIPAILQLSSLSELESGEISLDTNGDGWYEEMLVFSNGSLSQWFIDKDQDGVYECLVQYNSQREVSEISLGNATVRYFTYPYLDSVEIQLGDIIKKYSFLEYEGRFLVPGLDYNIPFFSTSFPIVSLKEGDLFRECRALEYIHDDMVLNQYILENGEIFLYKEDCNSNGTFDHVLTVRDRVILSGKRDQDEDGYFEIHEEFKKGQFIGFSLDADGNNIPEFFEDWSLLHIMAWDGDQDSHLDDLYIASRDGSLYRQGMAFPDIITKRDLLAWDFTYERHLFR